MVAGASPFFQKSRPSLQIVIVFISILGKYCSLNTNITNCIYDDDKQKYKSHQNILSSTARSSHRTAQFLWRWCRCPRKHSDVVAECWHDVSLVPQMLASHHHNPMRSGVCQVQAEASQQAGHALTCSVHRQAYSHFKQGKLKFVQNCTWFLQVGRGLCPSGGTWLC